MFQHGRFCIMDDPGIPSSARPRGFRTRFRNSLEIADRTGRIRAEAMLTLSEKRVESDLKARGCSANDPWLALRFERNASKLSFLAESWFRPKASSGFDPQHRNASLWSNGVKSVTIYFLEAACQDGLRRKHRGNNVLVASVPAKESTSWVKSCFWEIQKAKHLDWCKELFGSRPIAGKSESGLQLLCKLKRPTDRSTSLQRLELWLPNDLHSIRPRSILVYTGSHLSDLSLVQSPKEISALAIEIEAQVADWEHKLKQLSDDNVRSETAALLPRQSATGHQPIERDWDRSDVQEFLKNVDLHPLCIDSAIVLFRAPERTEQKWRWCDDSEIRLQIEDRLIRPSDLTQFKAPIKRWQQENKNQKRGIKYCVTEVDHQPAENGGVLTLKVRPIEWHTVKPVTDILISSYSAGSNAFTCGESGAFRRKFFSHLQDRDHPPLPNILSAVVSVVSSDKKLLFFKRRKSGLGYPHTLNCWSASFEETFNADWKKYLNPAELFPPASTPDGTIFQGLQRGLREELKLTPETVLGTELQALAFGLDFGGLNTLLFVIAKLPVTAEAILGNTALRSGEEHDCSAYCPFTIPALSPVLKNGLFSRASG